MNNQIDPSRLSPIALNFAKYLPVDQADPCGKVQYGIPQNNTEHRALTKVDYTLNNQQSIFTRYLYAVYDNPATYDGKNVLTLSRTGQNNQAHSMVVGHNFVLSSFVNALRVTYNKTLNDRPLPEFFTATDLGSKVYSPLPGYMGINVTGNGFAVGNGGTNPGYFDSDSWQLADDVDLLKGDHQISFGGNWIHTKIETLNNRPTNGAFTFNGQSTGLSLADFMMGALSGGFLQGNPVYDYDDHDYIGAYVQDDWRVAPERDRQRRRALGAVHPAAQHLQLGEQLRPGALRCRHQEHGVSAGAGRIVVPGRRRVSGPRHDRQQDGAVRAASRRDLDAGRRRQHQHPRRLGRVLRHAAPVLQHALCEQPAVGRADHAVESRRAAGPIRIRPIPAAIRSRRSTPDGRRSRSRRSAST